MTYRVYLSTHTYQSREPYDDGWDRGDTDGYIDDVQAVKVSDDMDRYRFGYRDQETELTPPFYVVYAGYTTGNTFGSDFEATVVGITATREEAEALADEAREFVGFGELSNGFYVPWNGYFESLRDVYVKGLM